MINHKFISFSAVQIYDLSYIDLHDFASVGEKVMLRVTNITERYLRNVEFTHNIFPTYRIMTEEKTVR